MLFLIDTYSLLYRLFFALPDLTFNGIHINAIYGLCRLSVKLTKEYKVENLIFCVDKGRSGRSDILKTYKAHRKPTSDKFKQQIPIFYEFVKAAGFYVYGIEGLEADDTIFTLAKYFKKQGYEKQIFILTGDKDMLQVLSDKVSILLIRKGITDVEVFDEERFNWEYGFSSKFFIYYKALVGDPSDNIKGVKGIGPKKAIQIIKNVDSNNIKDGILKFLSSEDINIFLNNLELISLKDYSEKIEIDLDLEKTRVNQGWYRNESFKNFLRKYNFVSILKEIEEKQLRLF
ncbi:MAG: 5'-3' exonuclease H3TH domain-containing protein [bacterium]